MNEGLSRDHVLQILFDLTRQHQLLPECVSGPEKLEFLDDRPGWLLTCQCHAKYIVTSTWAVLDLQQVNTTTRLGDTGTLVVAVRRSLPSAVPEFTIHAYGNPRDPGVSASSVLKTRSLHDMPVDLTLHTLWKLLHNRPTAGRWMVEREELIKTKPEGLRDPVLRLSGRHGTLRTWLRGNHLCLEVLDSAGVTQALTWFEISWDDRREWLETAVRIARRQSFTASKILSEMLDDVDFT